MFEMLLGSILTGFVTTSKLTAREKAHVSLVNNVLAAYATSKQLLQVKADEKGFSRFAAVQWNHCGIYPL